MDAEQFALVFSVAGMPIVMLISWGVWSYIHKNEKINNYK